MIGSLARNRPHPRGGVVLQGQDPDLVVLVHVTNVAQLEAAAERLAGVELPEGGRGQIRIEGPGYGILARAAGMELLWGNRLVPLGARLVDVRGEGFNFAVVDFEAPFGSAPAGYAPQGIAILMPLLIVGLVVVLSAAGMSLFNSLAVLIERLGEAIPKIGALVIVVAVAAVVVAGSIGGRSRSP